MKPIEFKHHTVPVINQRSVNSTLDFKNYHVSYNPSSAGYGTKTTAIVIAGRLFFILAGDHREPLRDMATAGGLAGCVQYFIDNIGQAHDFSEHKQATGRAADPCGLMPTLRDAISPELFQALFDASN